MKRKVYFYSLLMAIVMMAMSPMNSWAEEPTLVTKENYSTLGLTSYYVGYYAIADADGMVWMAEKLKSDNVNYKLMEVVLIADIDLSDIDSWTPIGSGDTKFMGTFDGNGHSITGMNIPNYTTSYQGLFAWVEGTSSKHAILKNFSLRGTMTSSTEGPDYIGSVVGRCADYVDMTDITNNVNINIAAGVKQNHMGGIAGWCKATTMTRCVNNGNINAGATSNCIAGVMGYGTTTCKLTNCLNTGNITSTADDAYISGILGYINNANFQGAHNCLNIGTITGGSANTQAGAIYGRYGQNAATKSTNNYYLSTSATKGCGTNGSTDNLNNAITSVNAERLASGEICYLLNGSKQSSFIWYQTIGTDASPLQDSTHGCVYYYSKLCDSNGNWTGQYITPCSYSNTENCVVDDERCLQYVESKAVFNNGTLTFYHDYIKHDGTTYALNTGNAKPNWNYRSDLNAAEIDASFASARPTSFYFWFNKFDNQTSIPGLEYLNTENVTNMDYMFYNCSKLTSLDLSNFNTANVTGMTDTFRGCSNLASLTLGCNFTTDNVTNMSGMFRDCAKLTTLDLSNFNTGNVTNMYYMFSGCASLASLTLGNNFTTDNVTDMKYMFSDCSNLTSLDLSSFNTGNVVDMQYMFNNCAKLTSLDLSNFNTAKVTNMKYMFNGCTALTSLDVSNFNTANVENMVWMFKQCTALTSLNLNSFDSSNLLYIYSMFSGCSNLQSLSFGNNFNISKVKDMEFVFYNCSKLTSLDLSSFNTANVIDMHNLFNGCSELTSLTLSSNFKTDKVTTMEYMFNDCSKLTSLDLSNFNTEKATDMSYMFYNCKALKSLDLSSFNTENATNMSYMFKNCHGLTSLDLSNFNTANATKMSGMIENCSHLTSLTIGNFDMQKVTSSNYILSTITATLKTLTLKSVPFLKDQTFNSKFKGAGTTVNYVLDDNSVIYTGANYLPNNAETINATYSREMSNQWGTLVLPFDVTYAANNGSYKLYSLSAVSNENLTFTEFANEAVIAAGTPMAVKAIGSKNDAGKYEITLNGAGAITTYITPSAATDGITMEGTYKTTDLSGDDYFISNNKFWRAGDFTNAVKVAPFRAYLHSTTTDAKASSFSINIAGESVTAVETINAITEGAAEYYDINGRRFLQLQKGMNIVKMGNGQTKKVIIK